MRQTPAFSADGSKIVWSGIDPETGNNEIFVMNADGSNGRPPVNGTTQS